MMPASAARGDRDESPEIGSSQGADSQADGVDSHSTGSWQWTSEEWQAWYESWWTGGSQATRSQPGGQSEETTSGHHGRHDGGQWTSTTASNDPWQWRDPWSGYHGENYTEERGGGADKIVAPEFSAEEDREGVKARGYLRKIEAWRRVTRIKPYKQALVLYNALTGRAWRDAEELDLAALDSPKGVEYFIDWVTNRYLDKEVIKAGRYMSEFFKQFKRHPSQEIREFNTEFDRHLGKLKEIGCSLPGACVAWWYVDKLRLDNAVELSLLSSVGNIYDLPRLQEAAIIQDRMNRRIWENHKKPDFKDKKPGGHQAYIAGVDEVTDDEEAFDGDDFDSEEHEIDENDDEKTHEAFVAYQNAKAKYNNIMKARGTSMGQSKEDRLRIAKSRSFCSVCHKKGHWHKDPECPMNKDKNQVAHTTHVVFFTDGASAGLKAIVDCACSRTLAGTRWMREYLRESRRMGIPYFIIDQNEVFKFGGPKLFPSKKAAVCWFCLEGRWWILKISVVAVDVPLLISRPALADLAMNYDIKENKASFGALGLPEVTLGFTQTGHPCLDVDHLSRPAPSWPEEVDWSTTEIFVPNHQHNTGEETVARNSGAYMASSLDRGWHKLFYPKVENHVEELMLLGDLSAETFLHWWHQQRDTDRDFWVESADFLIRVHVTPRRTFFDPRTWRTKDNTLKTQMLEALGDQRTTTCVPCTNSIRVLKIEHEWRTSHGARADFLWVGRSIFKRQARKLSPTTQLNSFDELDRPNLAMEDEQGSVDGGVGGARSGGAERVDRGPS